jgi:hypothetical protein
MTWFCIQELFRDQFCVVNDRVRIHQERVSTPMILASLRRGPSRRSSSCRWCTPMTWTRPRTQSRASIIDHSLGPAYKKRVSPNDNDNDAHHCTCFPQARTITPEQQLPLVHADDVDKAEDAVLRSYHAWLNPAISDGDSGDPSASRGAVGDNVIMPAAETGLTKNELEERCLRQELSLAEYKAQVCDRRL